MLSVIDFIFRTLKKFVTIISNTISPIPGVSFGGLYFGLVFAGLISYILFSRLLRGEKSE